ncbi:MAG: YhbY family RNA-binding protein [Myxococcaceae bacterium]|nr:YhbY family RNA-binding protein [Myxococcaceae bacterium]
MNLKSEAHLLKPVVQVGKNGITEAVLSEIDAALKAHELIKVKFQGAALSVLKEDLSPWIQALSAQHINTQGHIVTLYRKQPKKKA